MTAYFPFTFILLLLMLQIVTSTCFGPKHELIHPSYLSMKLRPMNKIYQPWKMTSKLEVNQFIYKRSPLTQICSQRGGGVHHSIQSGTSKWKTISQLLPSFWATFGTISIIVNSLRKLVPIALQPFQKSNLLSQPMTPLQTSIYAITILIFAYSEGYKGFQCKFSPLVVSRSLTLSNSQQSRIHKILGPFYAMGFLHATPKRKFKTWIMSVGVAGLVVAVKLLEYPWRSILDGGVVVGLGWGCVSMAVCWVNVLLLGKEVYVDPELPKSVKQVSTN